MIFSWVQSSYDRSWDSYQGQGRRWSTGASRRGCRHSGWHTCSSCTTSRPCKVRHMNRDRWSGRMWKTSFRLSTWATTLADCRFRLRHRRCIRPRGWHTQEPRCRCGSCRTPPKTTQSLTMTGTPFWYGRRRCWWADRSTPDQTRSWKACCRSRFCRRASSGWMSNWGRPSAGWQSTTGQMSAGWPV